MSKTIKIIDLLNKISNGEIPIKVKFKGNIYIYEKDNNDYTFIKDGYYHWLLAEHMDILFLNKEVELIEDETIDINNVEEIKFSGDGYVDYQYVIPKINKILQWAKQTDKEIKSIKEK